MCHVPEFKLLEMGRVPQQRHALQNAETEHEYSECESGKFSDIHVSEMGGGAPVPHFLTDLGGPGLPPHFFPACHWLLRIRILSENVLSWHDQISNRTARNRGFPGPSAIMSITIETQNGVYESDRFGTPHSMRYGGVVGRFSKPFVARTA